MFLFSACFFVLFLFSACFFVLFLFSACFLFLFFILFLFCFFYLFLNFQYLEESGSHNINIIVIYIFDGELELLETNSGLLLFSFWFLSSAYSTLKAAKKILRPRKYTKDILIY